MSESSSTSGGIGLGGLLVVLQIIFLVLSYSGILVAPTWVIWLPAIVLAGLMGLGILWLIVVLGGIFLFGVVKGILAYRKDKKLREARISPDMSINPNSRTNREKNITEEVNRLRKNKPESWR